MIAGRFTGTVERLGAVNVRTVADWIAAIPFEAWPQQERIRGELRPAMVNDRHWHQFGAVTDPIVVYIRSMLTSGSVELNRLLSVVMPGHTIDPHVDKVTRGWWGRVHVPLTSAPGSLFIVGGAAHYLEPGWAYVVNVTTVHSVENLSTKPRVHLMFDVGSFS